MQKYRFLSDYLPPSSKRRLIVLTGARQAGKTTLAKAKYPELRYINNGWAALLFIKAMR